MQICAIQMLQEQSQSVSFISDQQRTLFNILTSKVHYQDKIYTQQDLQVDLVLRLPLPKHRYIPRRYDFPFNQLFWNTPPQYIDAYETVRQYINFQVDGDLKNHQNFKELQTKGMTSILTLACAEEKMKEIYLFQEGKQTMILDCDHAFFPEIDVFTLRYNMIMLILQSLCGFRVKTYLIEQPNQKCVYFMLSHSIENYMKLADRHQIMKEVNMKEVDFYLNDPVDSAQRPLKCNSYFRNKDDLMFQFRQKTYARTLKVKNSMAKVDIVRQVQLSHQEIHRFISYCEQFEFYLKQLSEKNIGVTSREKQFLFKFNRGKSNDGCYDYLKQMKFRELVYQKIIQLNKKYGYSTYQYKNCFFKFQLPPKNKSFFERLAKLMIYKPVVSPLNGQFSLFNSMEKLKLSYLSLQSFLKVENLHKIGLQVFAINNNYQRFGTQSFNLFTTMKSLITFDFKKHRLIDQWHSFIPFLTDINAVKNYMGQQFAYQLLVKIHLGTFFACLIPMSIGAQFIGVLFFANEKGIFPYQFSIIYLVLVIISLTLFQITWKRKQDEFIRNFIQQDSVSTHKDNYKGPYIRDIVNDQPNEYTLQLTLQNRIIRFFAFLGVGILLLIEAFFFYGLRVAILMNYNSFPKLPTIYISLPHLIFYAVFFWSNYLVYRFAFSKIIVKLIQFQNFPTKQQQLAHLRGYIYIFTFGVELLGPLFIYVIEPFQGNSCHSASCIEQFSIYIYSRYFIIFSFLIIKIVWVIGFYFTGSIIEMKDALFQNQKNQDYLSFQEKYNQLLQHIQKQYEKRDISFEIREQALSLYYYCIYSVILPFCSVLALGLILIDYIVVRIDVLRNGRRPIPQSKSIIRLSGVYKNIVHLCIIVNSWSVIYIQEVLEYNFPELIEYFIVQISRDNILQLKIVFTALLIGALEIISGFVKQLSSGVNTKLQNRKRNMYKNFVVEKGRNEARQKSIKFQQKMPLKTVFRTFSIESINYLKQSRFKHKNKAQFLKELNEKYNVSYVIAQPQETLGTFFNKNILNFNEQNKEQTQSELIQRR